MAQINDKRPNEVRNFEKMQLTTLGLGIIVAALGYEKLIELSDPITILMTQFIVLLFLLWIILSITRKKSKIAKWILVGFNIIGIPFYIPQLSFMLNNGIQGWLSVIQLIINFSSLYLLFQPRFTEYLKTKK
jgi:hypothetical protein